MNAVDALGRKLLVIDIEASKVEGEAFKDKGPIFYSKLFSKIDEFLKEMEKVTDAFFEAAKTLKRVKFDGKDFTGTRQQFIDLVKREKESVWLVANAAGYQGSLAKLKELAKLVTEDHDELAFVAHGKLTEDTETHEITASIPFNGEEVPRDTAIAAIRQAGSSAAGHFVMISCFRTWSPTTENQKSTMEGVAIQMGSGDGNVAFQYEVKSIGGVPISQKIVGCSVFFRPIRITKTVGGKVMKGVQKYEAYAK